MEPDELDKVIDELAAGPRVDGDAGDVGDAEVVGALRRLQVAASEPLPPASRSRHLAAIHGVDTAPTPASRARLPWGLRLRRGLAPVTAVLAALALVGGGGTVAFAQDVAPDHVLYPVKRGAERAWVALPRGPEGAAQVQLALAERRIEEAARSPEHAEVLVEEGMSNVEAAAGEKPEEALATFARLLGTGPDALPAQASPRARAALYRNCLRIAERHGLAHACPEPADLGEHPGRGRGAGPGGAGSDPATGPRGWGPGGRPDGAVGPPPGVPGRGRGGTDDDAGVDSSGTRRGWGPGGRPEGVVGPPPGVPGHGRGGDDDADQDAGPNASGGDAGVGPVGGGGPGGQPEGEGGLPPGSPGTAGDPDPGAVPDADSGSIPDPAAGTGPETGPV